MHLKSQLVAMRTPRCCPYFDELSVVALLFLEQRVFPQDSRGVQPDLCPFFWIVGNVGLETLVELQFAYSTLLGLWLAPFGGGQTARSDAQAATGRE